MTKPALGRSLTRMRTPSGVGCMSCGRQDVSLLDVEAALAGGPVALCGRCRRELRPTPLDLVLMAAEMSPRAFAEETGVGVLTVIRASKGVRVGKRNAARLAAVTGLKAEVFRW